MAKRKRPSTKGTDFERDICRAISMWWTEGEEDGTFWRTSMSGGRATIRAQKGKRTPKQAGDITAVHPLGNPLTHLFTIELKTGYKESSIHDMMDRQDTHTNGQIEEFIQQAERAAKENNTKWWIVIHRRTGRKIMIYLPYEAAKKLWNSGETHLSRCRFQVSLKYDLREGGSRQIWGTQLMEFFELVSPDSIRHLFKTVR